MGFGIFWCIQYGSFCSPEFQKISFKGERYEVSLPWKDPDQILSDNYQLCQRRLGSLIQHLQQNPEILKEYDSIIQNQIKQGIVEYIEKPTQEEFGRIHYLPHHAVIRHERETTKIQVISLTRDMI